MFAEEGIPVARQSSSWVSDSVRIQPNQRRIGIMGGTFNPIHVGHTEMAKKACEQLALSQVLFIPVGTPPHKPGVYVADAADRLRMVQLAIEGDRRFSVNTIELERTGYTYAVDTLRQLQQEYGKGTEFYYILGGDAFLYLEHWSRFEEAIRMCTYVVFHRAGVARDEVIAQMARLREDYSARIILVDYEPTAVSSTLLRECLQNGSGCLGLLDPKVEAYIRWKGLYLDE